MKKIIISEEAHKRLNLICFLQGKSMKDFVEDIIMKYRVPRYLKINKDTSDLIASKDTF